jgi:hypothetical protein
MSVIHINQIKNKIIPIFENHLDLKDLSETDSSREIKIATRCLAAYAVYNSIGCSPEEAAHAVVDGGDDNGLDAIFYSQQYRQLILVQSKWNKDGKGEPDSADIGKFCRGVKDLFEMNFDRFNEKIQSKEDLITTALNKYDTRYKLILIDTSEKQNLAEHSQRQINDLLEEMNNTGDENIEALVNYSRLNQGKVFSSLARSMGDEPIEIEIGISEWGMIKEPNIAYYGAVSALEVAKWWDDYGRRLFHKNIRQVLGTTDVNQEMEETLKLQPEKFWYYNNGITIVADDIQKTMVGGATRDFGAFKLSNISIVNGAQTVSTIGKFCANHENETVNAKIHVKIVNLQNASEDFGRDITRANNRQNRIENRDFISQDPDQNRIKMELSLEGVEYNIVRSDNFSPSDTSFDLQEATVALACASGQSNLAVLAKSGIGKFYDGIEGSKYRTLFNPSVTGLYMFNAVCANRAIEKIITARIHALTIKRGRHYGLLVHGNRIIALLVMKELNYQNLMQESNFSIDSTSLQETTNNIIDYLSTVLQDQYADNILGTLFKNLTKCSVLVRSHQDMKQS